MARAAATTPVRPPARHDRVRKTIECTASVNENTAAIAGGRGAELAVPCRTHPKHPRSCLIFTTEGHLDAVRAKKRLNQANLGLLPVSGGGITGA